MESVSTPLVGLVMYHFLLLSKGPRTSNDAVTIRSSVFSSSGRHQTTHGRDLARWSGHNTLFISHYPTNEMIQSEKAKTLEKQTEISASPSLGLIDASQSNPSFLCFV